MERAGGEALDKLVHLVSFHVDSGERTCWAEILAGTAAYAALCVNGWNLRKILVAVRVNHLYGTCRTVARTVAARYLLLRRYAVLLYPDGMANLRRRLIGEGDELDGIPLNNGCPPDGSSHARNSCKAA